jgi:Domain of unknown function (DUF4340)
MKRSTWFLLLLFLATVGVFIFLKYRPAQKVSPLDVTPTTTTANRKLFLDDSSAVTAIRIFDKQYHIVFFERPSGGLWTVKLPTEGPANQAQAEAAATQAAALEVLDTLNSSITAENVGLEFPMYTLKLTLQTTGQHQLDIGEKTPVGDGYYVRFDNGPIYIIGASGIDALLNLLISPPYLPTATPTHSVIIGTPTP